MELLVLFLLSLFVAACCGIAILIISKNSEPSYSTKSNPITYIRGAAGEWSAVKELSKLPHEYGILTDYQISYGGNVDAIVVGPTGIFAIEVKSHKGNVTFTGEKLLRNGLDFEKNFLKQVGKETLAIRDHLEKVLHEVPFIRGIVVFTEASVKIGPRPIKSTYVINKNGCAKLSLIIMQASSILLRYAIL